jgi:hypothetical protein
LRDPARRLPPHQLLGVLLVVLEESPVGLALDQQRLEAELLGLLLMLFRRQRVLQRGGEFRLDIFRAMPPARRSRVTPTIPD